MPFNDPWQRDLEQHELDGIYHPKYSIHAAEYFAKALRMGVKQICSRLLPKEERVHFDRAWNGLTSGTDATNPYVRFLHAIDNDIASRVNTLDKQHGGHGGKGAEWVDKHLQDIEKKIKATLGASK